VSKKYPAVRRPNYGLAFDRRVALRNAYDSGNLFRLKTNTKPGF
jgi:hypothetical protein